MISFTELRNKHRIEAANEAAAEAARRDQPKPPVRISMSGEAFIAAQEAALDRLRRRAVISEVTVTEVPTPELPVKPAAQIDPGVAFVVGASLVQRLSEISYQVGQIRRQSE